MICPYCGQEHPDDFQYCPQTGQPIPQLKACINPDCPNYGKHILPLEAKFCPRCGSPLENVEEEERQTMPRAISKIIRNHPQDDENYIYATCDSTCIKTGIHVKLHNRNGSTISYKGSSSFCYIGEERHVLFVEESREHHIPCFRKTKNLIVFDEINCVYLCVTKNGILFPLVHGKKDELVFWEDYSVSEEIAAKRKYEIGVIEDLILLREYDKLKVYRVNKDNMELLITLCSFKIRHENPHVLLAYLNFNGVTYSLENERKVFIPGYKGINYMGIYECENVFLASRSSENCIFSPGFIIRYDWSIINSKGEQITNLSEIIRVQNYSWICPCLGDNCFIVCKKVEGNFFEGLMSLTGDMLINIEYDDIHYKGNDIVELNRGEAYYRISTKQYISSYSEDVYIIDENGFSSFYHSRSHKLLYKAKTDSYKIFLDTENNISDVILLHDDNKLISIKTQAIICPFSNDMNVLGIPHGRDIIIIQQGASLIVIDKYGNTVFSDEVSDLHNIRVHSYGYISYIHNNKMSGYYDSLFHKRSFEVDEEFSEIEHIVSDEVFCTRDLKGHLKLVDKSGNEQSVLLFTD